MGFSGGGGSSSIATSTDVALNNPADTEVLTYVSSVGKWENKPAAVATDATTSTKGVVKLAGDLAGTAALPTVPGLAGKEPSVTATTSADYYRGDKTFQTLNKAAVGLGNVDNTSDTTKNSAVATLTNKTLTSPAITTPTGIVKGDVGLGNVDNTSDATKNAAAVTLTNKTLTSPVINTPTGIVKGDVGLGNVDNTSDANKPVSTAQAAANNLRVLKAGDTMSGDLNIPSNRLGVGLTNTASATIETITDATHQGVRVQAVGSTNLSYATFVAGDAQLRYLVSANGDLNWSSGAAGVDTSLVRSAAGELTVNSKLTTTSLKVTGGTLASGKALVSDASGNATWQVIDKTTLGLGNVDNTSDANKPVSTATQTALDLKADATTVGVKTLLINTAGDLPAGTPAGVVVVVKS